MRWASALSRTEDPVAALDEAADAVRVQLGATDAQFAVVFASPEHGDGLGRVAAAAARRFPGALLMGNTASGVIGAAREAEEGPALSLTVASLHGVALSPFRLEPAGDALPAGASPGGARPKILLLADPYTVDVAALVARLDRVHPGAPKFGGLASGGRAPGENRLLLGPHVYRGGAVGVVFTGDLEVDTLVAQGCRPVGAPMIVTRCRGQLLLELDGRAPLEVVSELYAGLDARDRELAQHSLFVGLELRPDAVEHAAGELLVRNLLGADRASGALVVGAELRPMMVVQFMLRDAHAAEEELRRMLSSRRRAGGRPAGALLFSCVGRGAGLFGVPDHDTALFEEQLGPAPLGGFFCNGEIGPVGGATFLHGYTSAFALFRERGGP